MKKTELQEQLKDYQKLLKELEHIKNKYISFNHEYLVNLKWLIEFTKNYIENLKENIEILD